MAVDAIDRPAPIGPLMPAWTRPLRVASPVVLVVASLAAVAFDLAVRSNPIGVAGAIFVWLVAGTILSTGEMANRQSQALAVIAVAFGSLFVLRSSPWLAPFNVLAAGSCLIASASLARSGSLLDISAPRAVLRIVHAGINGLAGPGYIISGRGKKLGPVIRGLVIAVPLALVLGALLAAGDAVFASVFDFDASDYLAHAALLIVGLWLAAGVGRIASAKSMDEPNVKMPKLGPVEWTIVLVVLDVLYLGFGAARIVAATDGGGHVLRTAGLTYAEYARSGFFELLGAAAITLVALVVLRAVADVETRSRFRFAALSIGTVVLTLLVVASAFQRLVLYEHAFGLSMLRLYSMVFCVWLVLALCALGLWIGGVGGGRPWFWAAAAASALVLLFALNVFNPAAFVVRHNVTAGTQDFDVDYADELSEDAVPALVDVASEGDAELLADTRRVLCDVDPSIPEGWAGFNFSRHNARSAIDSFCPGD